MTPTAEALPDDSQEQETDYGPDNRDLPQQIVDAFRSTICDFQGQEKYARRKEVRRDRTNRFYDEGYQYVQWSGSGNSSGYQLLTPGAWVPTPGGGSVQCPQYMDAYNIFHAYLWVIISVLTQNPPGIQFQPVSADKSEDIDAAKAAEGYSHAFDRHNDVNGIMRNIARMMGVSGRVVSWTRTEQDAQKFGYEDDGVTPKRFQCTDIFGTLESKVPITARSLDKDFAYCLIYRDKELAILKDTWEWIAQKIKAGAAALDESQFERQCRLGVLSSSRGQSLGDTMNHVGTEVHAFLRPCVFTGETYDHPFTDEGAQTVQDEDGEHGETVGEAIKRLFPDGVRVVFVGDTYAASYAESLDDHIDVQHPFPGDGQFRQAFMDPALVIQDNVNDLMNWVREKFDTGAGTLWMTASQDEIDAITSQRAAPNAVRPLKLASGTASAKDNIYQEPDPEVKQSLVQYLEMLQGPFLQFILAAPPALFGESMPDQKTASGYAQARNQATGRIGLLWGRMQSMFARIRYQSALAAANEPTEAAQIVVPGKSGQVTVNLENLRKGKFGCYPDEDSSFPESTQQKRATLQGLLTMAATNPAALQLLLNPDNIEEIKRLMGFEELVFLPAEARNKQVFEIEELLKGAPIPPDPLAAEQAAAMGAPPPQPQSSVPVDELDYHADEFAKCQEWLSSAARREQDARGNSDGVLNVKLHALAHKQALAAMMPPPMPPMPAGHSTPPPPGPPSAPPPAIPI